MKAAVADGGLVRFLGHGGFATAREAGSQVASRDPPRNFSDNFDNWKLPKRPLGAGSPANYPCS
jgi:hypothetical protein